MSSSCLIDQSIEFCSGISCFESRHPSPRGPLLVGMVRYTVRLVKRGDIITQRFSPVLAGSSPSEEGRRGNLKRASWRIASFALGELTTGREKGAACCGGQSEYRQWGKLPAARLPLFKALATGRPIRFESYFLRLATLSLIAPTILSIMVPGWNTRSTPMALS